MEAVANVKTGETALRRPLVCGKRKRRMRYVYQFDRFFHPGADSEWHLQPKDSDWMGMDDLILESVKGTSQ